MDRETANAFIAYQNFNHWRMNGAALVDWQKVLKGFADADRRRNHDLKVKDVGITKEEFWAFVKAEHIERPTANAWIRSMKKHRWMLLNPANGRREPIRDWRAALRAFVSSELNQILESIDNYRE